LEDVLVRKLKFLALVSFLLIGIRSSGQEIQRSTPTNGAPAVPKTWDDEAIATLEVPLANPMGSPKHVSANYYYKIPVRPIYKQYPVYAPGHEPAGYMDRLMRQEPVIVWDDTDHRPPLRTEADWIKAGEVVFDAPISYGEVFTLSDVRSAEWYEKSDMPIAKDGVLPFLHYVIRKKGTIEVGMCSCGMCHTRVMSNGTTLKGAQGNMPFDRALANTIRTRFTLEDIRALERSLFSVPWLSPDPQASVGQMSLGQIASLHEAIPPGVLSRNRSSAFYPPQIPDLIGMKERKYLDRTGLQQQRSLVDLMRYAALNQGADSLASFDGFLPVDIPTFKKLPDPADPRVGGRYSDEQLYALALYVYSLQPPPNPNKFDALAERGQKVFEREHCVMCHTPPLYTNNTLSPAEGFSIPPDHLKKYDILPISVGTDPTLTLKTRRGTGYYKVPSLKGVWYRGLFGHSGWCATLEDWFDPRRTHDDYVPTGFKPYGARSYAVKGHPFGLNLLDEDRKALIAFLKTL
jgi:hypothetical protein